jgi:ketosteroid isomerase-like protein
MSEVVDQNVRTREVVERLNTARNTNDVEAIAALLSEDVEWWAPASLRDWPLRGRDKVTRGLTGGSTGKVLDVDTIRREVTQIVVEGHTAVVRQLMTATLLAGGEYRNDYCWIYTVTDGTVRRIEEYGDTLVIARAGFVPLQPTAPAASGSTEEKRA